MAEFKQSIIICIAALLALAPNAVNALQAHLYPQKNGLCASFKDYNKGPYDYICGVRTGTIEAEDGIFRVAIYTGIPKEPIPSENIHPQHFEYYEWTGYINLRLDDNGCLQPVDKNEAGSFTTQNNCPPAEYPTSTLDGPDIPNPYYLVKKSRASPASGQQQSFLQPNLDNPELSVPFVSNADTGIINDKIIADGAGFVGELSDSGLLRPVVSDQVAAAPVDDYNFYDWGVSSFRRKLKQRRRSV